jgi:hypothetical protein
MNASPADVDVRAEVDGTPDADPRRRGVAFRMDADAVVPTVATVLVVVHLAVRAWTAAGGWLARQDLLAGASVAGLPVDLGGPPGSVALAEAVASTTPLSWPALVALELIGQCLVDVVLYRLLVELFGRRPAVLLPLTVYLTSSLPLVGGVWWSAALVQLPLQLVLLCALLGHVRYLRTRTRGALATSALAVAVGLLFAVEVALVPLLLLAATLLWATGGPLGARLRKATRLRAAWGAHVAAVLVGGGARLLLSGGPPVDGVALAEGIRQLPELLTRTVLPGLVGGPWSWRSVDPPLAAPAPPEALVWGAPAALAAVVLGSLLLSRGAVRAWLVVVAAGAVVLVGAGLTPAGGTEAGRLPLGVVPPAMLAVVAALGLGLAFLPVRGAPTVLRRRRWTGGRWLPAGRVRAGVGLVVAGALAAGWLVSTTAFARHWSDNAARGYVEEARASVVGRPELVLADTAVPDDVIPGELAPANTASVLLSGLPGLPRFLQDGEIAYQLTTLDERGRGQLAYVDAVSTSRTGPDPDCGWLTGPEAADVPLRRAAPDGRWIVQISYYGGEDNVIRVEAGGTVGGALIGRGVHDLYMQVSGPVDRVVVTVDDPAKPICVGAVTVGAPRALTPGGS